MEPSVKNGDLYIDPVFDEKQSYLWTSDHCFAIFTWIVHFEDGKCRGRQPSNTDTFYVRAVR